MSPEDAEPAVKNKELPPMVTYITSYNLTQVDSPAGAYEMIPNIASYDWKNALAINL